MVLKDERAVVEAFHSKQRVEGLTHNFYRYPARFNPQFVRRIVSEFSDVGDVVLDPFMGGGTTIVEALAAGRRAVGVDINGLAHFITKVKTTPLSERDADELEAWSQTLRQIGGMSPNTTEGGYDPRARNLPEGMRQFLAAVLESIRPVRFPRQRNFLKCVLLRVGQWALDDRQELPTIDEMVEKLQAEVHNMLEGLRELVNLARDAGIKKSKITGARALFYGSVTEPSICEGVLRYGRKPKLVLTSPPYPGVHVLYHRWQVSSRRETPAPYWVADLRDGHGASYYTMGSRAPLGMRNYFVTLQRGFENLRSLLSPDTVVVQLVAFSKTETQLPLYLDALASVGYEALQIPDCLSGDGHIRAVPNRRWYTNRPGIADDASHEVLMIHRARVYSGPR